MRRFVVIGSRAITAPTFSLADIPGTSGRLDVLLRCVRASLLVSHGVRRDTVVYLCLLGPPRARSIRIDGAAAKYLRPDERSLATLVKKALAIPLPSDASPHDAARAGFIEARNGVAVAEGGLDAVLADLGPSKTFVLEVGGRDVRAMTDGDLDPRDGVFFVGDHLGFDEASRARIHAAHAAPISVGPACLHADDAIAVLHNELDRRG